MPQIKVWKHPRKNLYTENRYIHINRLKADAYKSYAKKEKARILKVIKEDYKQSKPINSFVEYLKFIKKHEKSIIRFTKLAYDYYPRSVLEENDTVLNLLSTVRKFDVIYSGPGKVEKISIKFADFTDYHTSYSYIFRTIYTINEHLLDCDPYGVFTTNGFVFPSHRNFKFNDIIALANTERKKQEEETIVSRLSGDVKKVLPPIVSVSNRTIILDYVSKIIDDLYTDRELTCNDIGKVVLIKANCDHTWHLAELVCFHKDMIMVSVFNSLLGLKRNEIKNIF